MTPLHHRDLGGEGRPPLVVLHGMLGSSRNWQGAGADLAAHFHVMAPDLRNHGRSPHRATMNYEEMVRDVLDWLDERGLPRVTLAGHSMGGKVAMLLACRHPERVERLIVVDIAPRNYCWPHHRDTFAAMNELDLTMLRSRAEAEECFATRVASWPLRRFLATNLERAENGTWSWQINLPVLTESLSFLEKNPLGAGDSYAGPAWFIAGGKSRYVESEDHATIRTHFPSANVVTLAEAGHNPHMETREAFVAALIAGSGTGSKSG